MKELRRKGFITLFFFLIITFVFMKVQGGFVSGFLYYTVLSLIIFETVLLLGSSGNVKVRRIIQKERLTAGDKLIVDLEIIFPGFLPLLWISIEDALPERLQVKTESNRIWRVVGFEKRIDYRYEIDNMPRGEYQLNEVVIRVGDLFGFFERKITRSLPKTVLVYPGYQIIRSFRSINDKNIGMTYALNRSAEDVTSVMGIRDYANGDRLSRIHWKATARTGQLKTKEFEYHVSNDFMFFVDTELRSYRGNPHLFERAVTLTASFVKYALANHFTVGLSAFRTEELVIPLARHQEQLVRIFEQLARLEADSTYPFVKLLLKQIPLLPYGTTVMVVTPQVTKELVTALSLLRLRKISVELFWVADSVIDESDFYSTLLREGVSIHFIDRDDIIASLKGVSGSGKVS